jgi:polyhydroxybutyrate depolymerase
LHVDPNRIYVTGFSNGGMLAYYLGSTMPGVIAAIAPVSATMGGRARPDDPLFVIPAPRAPLPVLVFHGMADQQIPYAGGRGAKAFEGRSDLSVAKSLSFWLRADRCDAGNPAAVEVSRHVRRYRYRCAAPGADVELYTVGGMGHAWPHETRKGWRLEYVLLDDPNNEVSATDLIWDFFRQHPKRRRRAASIR